jgi:hypothetical protein
MKTLKFLNLLKVKKKVKDKQKIVNEKKFHHNLKLVLKKMQKIKKQLGLPR